MQENLYDVAIIGGGPAGSTAATLLARAGRRVIVLEREKFPRFHIGESLLPFSTQAFDRLGVREKLDRTFIPKFGGEIISSCGSRGVRFYFKGGYRSNRDRAYQVTRSEFDKLLLDHSRENGAEVREETTVKNITFSDEDVKLDIETSAGATAVIEASYLIDCSGRQTVIGNFFNLKKTYDHLQKFSVFAHYENVDRLPGIDSTLIRMVRGVDRWFWMIPLTEKRISIGVVMDTAAFRATKLAPEAALEKFIAEQPLMADRMRNAERVSPVYSAGDYSYRNKKLFGDRWLLAGDAAGFIDPVFSSGVFLAIMSAEKAADTIDEVLRDESLKPRLFKQYSRRVNRVMDVYLTFVTSWYSGK
ncbi:MAG TPA: NAD(P)/FAD-dependent oxidoreductase, partial [Chthoniobacterales bacterium]|nr:NAD(P)/FAD-dependent oxidoreductase [Chthoniobacterales bacterium]